VIDRAEDWDGDAVPAARNRPADSERANASSADSPTAEDRPADAARTDAVPATPEQRSAAHRLYRDRVDHTYDVARIEAGEDAGSQHSQDQQHSQDARPRGASEEGATREADAEPGSDGEAGEAGEAEAPGAADTRARDAGSGAREPEAPEAKDAGARGAWAEAVPRLRAAWEEHERRFPERSRSAPSSEADGGWVGDGDRRLTPEQNTDASKACEDIRAEGREVIRPAMERVEAADPGRRLAGLEHMLKGEDRLKEKIADVLFVEPNLTAKQAADKVTDAVRFTFTYTHQRYAEGVLSDVERLKSEGFELIKLKNLWEKEQYKGINSQWRRPETGLRFEMQFHTPESLEAKEITHQAYERLRGIQVTQVERDELEDYQKCVNTQIVTPAGATKIEEFPRKHG
jgi:hypothetical protein